ncbi:cytochrome c biogenesis CcdA family protein [Paradesulfitobacterium ferrireducens]|uniref:cytochrome c biogenesis CcdA family protein n=1 Tax=Paradesulfitobacterium ferrireducens TaxID=2816476 RepID=UPI001A8F4E1F|nr:cytochrome c biogenesis protein CcdA [Paradesulfitobacterium ferrireducens]
MNVSIGLAFLGGLVSFFSPCVLPVVPAYFSFLVGTSIDGQISRRVLIIRSLFFVLGFSAIFVLLGVSASAAGQLIGDGCPFSPLCSARRKGRGRLVA